MKLKYLAIAAILCVSMANDTLAQVINGQIKTNTGEPLVGASIVEMDTQNGEVTDVNGNFSLEVSKLPVQLIASFIGFKSDTLTVSSAAFLSVTLAEETEVIGEVVIESSSTFIDPISPIMSQVLTEKELEKAACCNLSESFETNASVDVSFTDAVSGGKVIRVLGLDGRYVQLNRENLPNVRGLISRYGLGFISGTWIQSIDVGKGTGSVTTGYESMSGHINLEFKKPKAPESLYVNSYVNNFGRTELNVNKTFDISDAWSGAILFHSDYFGSEIDRNDDGFMDLPKSRQLNLLNRYGYSKGRWIAQLGIHLMTDEKSGGQLGFDFGDDLQTSNVYGFRNDTKRVELFGKTFLSYPDKPYKGLGFIYSLSHVQIDGGFGRNIYEGEESTFYGNLIHQSIIGNSFHQYKAGTSIMVDDFDEQYQDSVFQRREIVPGAYFEYAYVPGLRFSLVAGARLDHHNLYGNFFLPRLHLKYDFSDRWILRGSAGRGFRTPNVITEGYQFLISSRRLNILNDPLPEVSWNMGGSLLYNGEAAKKTFNIVADYYYTTFTNQLIFDRDNASDQLRVYNLEGQSYAHSFQLEVDRKLSEKLKIKSAYKYYDVRSTINGVLREVPGVAKHRFFTNVSYATRFEKWKLDGTVQWFSRMRMPDTGDKAEVFQRPATSTSFALVNMQVSRGFRKGNIYIGVENLFDFRQENPIIDPEDPFGSNFDASLVWGPVAGRVIYAGFRYKIKAKK